MFTKHYINQTYTNKAQFFLASPNNGNLAEMFILSQFAMKQFWYLLRELKTQTFTFISSLL